MSAQISTDRAVEPALRAVPMFQGVPQADLLSFIGRGRARTYPAGSFVVIHGDQPDQVYWVVEGRVQVSSTSADGRTQLHAVLGPGECFGELGVLASAPRSATVECLEDCLIWGVGGDEFLAFVDRHPSVARALLSALARQVIAHEALVEDLLFLDLRGRVAKRLLGLVATSWDDLPPDGTPLPWDISQTDLANLSGGSRENVNRVLGQFQKQGYIRRSGRRYILQDISALRRLAGV